MRKTTKQFLRKSLCGILCAAMLFTGLSVPEFSAEAAEIEITEETDISKDAKENGSSEKTTFVEETVGESIGVGSESELTEASVEWDEVHTSEADAGIESTKETKESDTSSEKMSSSESEVETSDESTQEDIQTEEEMTTEEIRSEVDDWAINRSNGENFLLNPGFEDANYTNNWSLSSSGFTQKKTEDPHNGSQSLNFNNPTKATVMQTVEGLKAGTYTFGAYLQGGDTAEGDLQYAVVKVYSIDADLENDEPIKEYRESCSLEGWKVWQNPEISNIIVSEGNILVVGIEINSSQSGAWGTIDDLYLYIDQTTEEPEDGTIDYKNEIVNLNFYVGDLDANAAEEVGFYQWGDSLVIDTTKNLLLTWGGWDDKDKNPVYNMEKVEGHSGWFSITLTANETIHFTSGKPVSSIGGFSIFRSKDKKTPLISCSGFSDSYPEIYKGLLDSSITAIKETDGVMVGYATIAEADEATKEPDNPDEPDQPREWTFEELATLIADADKCNEADYTKASWNTFSKALADAKEITEDAEKEEIMAAYEALGIAKNVLVLGSLSVAKIALSNDFITGADLSSYLSLKNSGVVFKDEEGNELDDAAFFSYLKDGGTNWVRIRVWNDPYDSNKKGYGGGNNDLEAAKKIGKWATDAGMKVLIDFHYSDFWADPGKQKEPKEWADYTVEQKAEAIETFTKDSLDALKAAGVNVGMVQVGNETTNKICGVTLTDWANSSKIFNAGSRAVRAFDKDCLVAIHFTNPERGTYANFAKNLDSNNVDYDVFASSYYPFWHGTTENLTTQLADIAKTYGKMVMVAETSWATTLNDQDGHDNTVRKGSNDDNQSYDFSVQGQADELRAVIKAVNDVNETASGKGIGVFYWEPAWISKNYVYRADGGVNQELLDENKDLWEAHGSGWAASFAGEYDADDAGRWYGGSAIDNQAWFDSFGNALPTAKVYNYIRSGETASEMAITSVKNPSDTIEMGDKVTYPEKVTVLFNDSTSTEYVVNWNAADKQKVDTENVGEYIVRGTVTCEYKLNNGSIKTETKEVTYTITVKQPVGENLLLNPGFETSNATNWDIDGTGPDGKFGEDVRTGKGALHFYNENTLQFTVTQKITNLQAGSYVFGGYIQGGATAASDLQYSVVKVYSKDADLENDEPKKVYRKQCSLNGWKNWQNPEITDIVVSDEDILIVGMEITSTANGAWGTIDDFYLYGIYDVTIDSKIEAGTGSINASRSKSVAGKEIKITAKPDDGYTLDKLTISGKGIKAETDVNNMLLQSQNGTVTQADGTITLVYPANTTVEKNETFIMPNGSVTISATFTSTGVVDKSALEELITDCEKETDSSKYTEASWTAFSEALEAAQAVFNNENATQAQINNAKNTLKDALDGLEIKVDFANLNALIEQYKDKKQDNYTDESWQIFQDALHAAEEIVGNPDATQAEVDEAKDALQAAFDGLRESTSDEIDFTKLNELLAECETLNEDDYTKASWEIFAKALAEAQTVSSNKDATQAEINNAKNALQEAKEALKTNREESLEALKNLIAEYEDKQQNNYTQESWDAFQEALKNAQDISNNENAKIEELNAAKEKLQSAYDALVESTSSVVDKTDLNNLITKYKDTPKGDYTEESWKVFQDALSAATDVSLNADATQAEVNNAKNNLQKAYEELVKTTPDIVDKTELNKLISDYQNLTQDDYTDKSWTNFQEALKEAQKINQSETATQTQVNDAKDALQSAFNALKRIPQGLWAEDIADMTYTGSALKPTIKVYDGKTLLTSKDYSISYKNNTKVTTESELANVVIKGKGNYSGTITKDFRILPKNLGDEDIVAPNLYALVASDNTTAVKLNPVVTRNGKKLKVNKEYTIEKEESQDGAYMKPGIYRVTLKAVDGSGYSGSKDITITLADKSECTLMSSVKIKKIANQVYNEGKPVEPDVEVTYKNSPLERGKDYEVKYSENNTQAGETVTVTVQGIEGSKYIGEKTTTFKITGTPLKASDIMLKDITNAGLVYTGKELEPIVESNTISSENYTATYQNNVEVGKATVLITGKNGYTGTVKKTFKITPYDIKANADKAFTYAENMEAPYAKGGSKLTDALLQAKFNGMDLVQGVDYTVSYTNNKKVGSSTAFVKIKGKGNFKGTTEAISFSICKQNLSELKDVSVADLMEKNAKKYKNNNPVVKDLDGKLLKKGTDYEIQPNYKVYLEEDSSVDNSFDEVTEISDNLLKAGTRIGVTIKGLGNYEGERTIDFRIIADNRNLSKAVIKVDEQFYTGKEIEPHGTEPNKEDRAVKVSIKVKENGTTNTYDLQEGVDYEIVGYTKNINKGTAKITIHGIGAYGGTKTGSFKIKQQPMKWYDSVNQMLYQLKELLN